MKNKKRISFIAFGLLWMLLFSTAVSAALPPTFEPQWENINTVVCGIIVTDDSSTATGSIAAVTGSYVEATATLYKLKNGLTTVEYFASTPENNPLPIASFTYQFVPQSGASYYFVMEGVVSKDGVEEVIERSDSKFFP